MITRKELEKYKIITGLNLGQIERDYLQHLTLMFLFKLSDNHLVFKGGTALQKVYGLNRFSEDLDFTVCEEKSVVNLMKKVCSNLALSGYESSFEIVKNFPICKNVRLKVKGPLYNGKENSIFYLLLEISYREKVVLDPISVEIKPVYQDISSYIIRAMDEKEILAEKIRTIFTRNASRDVFDLNFLLNKNVPLDLKLINQKLKYYNLVFNFKNFKKCLDDKESSWKTELATLVPSLPDFKKVKEEILLKIKSLK